MKTYACLHCGKENVWVRQNANKYCNNVCQKQYERKQRVRAWLTEGKDWKLQVPAWAKDYLAEQRGYACECCGTSEWQGKKIVLECDHIDGDHKNNHPTNLRLICPNCHSQTDTYKAKNKGNGRSYRQKV